VIGEQCEIGNPCANGAPCVNCRCDGNTSPTSSCGNGVREPGESCDGTQLGICGILGCNTATCQCLTSGGTGGLGGICGDGWVNPLREECDGIVTCPGNDICTRDCTCIPPIVGPGPGPGPGPGAGPTAGTAGISGVTGGTAGTAGTAGYACIPSCANDWCDCTVGITGRCGAVIETQNCPGNPTPQPRAVWCNPICPGGTCCSQRCPVTCPPFLPVNPKPIGELPIPGEGSPQLPNDTDIINF
jgi:hypothetical protein